MTICGDGSEEHLSTTICGYTEPVLDRCCATGANEFANAYGKCMHCVNNSVASLKGLTVTVTERNQSFPPCIIFAFVFLCVYPPPFNLRLRATIWIHLNGTTIFCREMWRFRFLFFFHIVFQFRPVSKTHLSFEYLQFALSIVYLHERRHFAAT